MKPVHRYITGFIFCLVLTGGAFALVQWHLATAHVYPTHEVLAPVLVLLALVQLVVQVVFFLHVGDEQKPRWRLMLLLFALLVVVILVGGTLWIMHNLPHGPVPTSTFPE